MRKPKVAMIGGGSYSWMPHIIRDIVLKPELESAEIRLLDLDLESAEIIAAVGQKYVKDWSLPATFLATTDADQALDGADAVVITISTGGLDAMAHDLRIPEKYGIYATVGDTVGPGGWARGLRNIPVFARFAEQIRRNAPEAFVLNYTNPMATLTGTLCAVSRQPAVGLCHGLFENLRTLMRIFDLKSESEISADYCGLNHFFWMTDFRIKGKPGYPALRSKLRGGKRINDLVRQAYVDAHGHSSVRRLVASELFEEYGYLPYLGDRHTCEFFSRYLAPEEKRLEKYGIVRTYIQDRRRNRARARQRALDIASGKQAVERKASRETAADIICARVTNRDFIDVMNLPNIGQVPNLPMGAVVETPGMINAIGFRPVACGPMPQSLANLCMPHAVNQKLIVEAGIEGSWDKAYAALINDPLCSHLTVPQIKKMGRELLEANRRHLPQFFGRKG
jgi:alpha-galactosidase